VHVHTHQACMYECVYTVFWNCAHDVLSFVSFAPESVRFLCKRAFPLHMKACVSFAFESEKTRE